MGLLDSLLGGLMGGTQDPRQQGGGMGAMGGAGTAAVIGIALQLLQRNGGLDGLLQKMNSAGAGSQAQSWVGTGQNQPIAPDMLSQIFGRGQMQDVARELGMSHDQAAASLAQALPNVVDQMTPAGSIPADSNDLVSRTLQDLMRRR